MSTSAQRSNLEYVLGNLLTEAKRVREAVDQIKQMSPVCPSMSTIEGMALPSAEAAVSAAALTLSTEQHRICERVLNVFETGTIAGKYHAIAIFADGPHDIRQITYGRSQTTEYGNLRELVEMYVRAGAMFSADLQPFVERIGRVALVDNARFKELLQRAGREDQVMRDTQDVFFDRRYFQPALRWAETNGFTLALSMLVIYDSFIHSGSILDLLRSRFPEVPPARGGNERTWIRQYVAVRHHWLANHSRPAVRQTTYRTRDLMREIDRGNWDLSQVPISANGVAVDGRADGGHSFAASGTEPGTIPYFGPDGEFGNGYSSESSVERPSYQDVAGLAADDPAAPQFEDMADLAGGRELANYGSDQDADFGASDAAPATGEGRLLALDINRAKAFLQACLTSTPRVRYGLGKKVPFHGATPGRDFTKVDCSGFVREAIRLSTNPMVAFPDGSVVQHDWIRAQGFTKSNINDAKQSDGFVRIAFLRPQDSPQHIGHVVLISQGRTLESHGGVGPNARPWTGAGWQARAHVYFLAREPSFGVVAEARSFNRRAAYAARDGVPAAQNAHA
jgi:chitosanase